MNPDFKEHSTPYKAHSILKCEENGRIFYLETGNAKFVRVKIDEGVIPRGSEQTRCDYIVIKQGKEDIEIFVELKGKNIEHAKEQLIATYEKYATKANNIKHYPAMAFSHVKEDKHRSPKTTTKIMIIKKELKNKFGNILLIDKTTVRARYDSATDSIEQVK